MVGYGWVRAKIWCVFIIVAMGHRRDRLRIKIREVVSVVANILINKTELLK
jgi:hypothetical protein